MARFGSKKIKRFTVSTRLVSGSRGNKISTITPGLRRIKPKAAPKASLIPTPQDPR